MLVYLLYGITLGFAAAIQPGPLSTYIISEALVKGWKRTLPAVFAPMISDGPIAILVLFVLSSFPAEFVQWLRLAGGFFILYLAWASFQSWRNFIEVPVVPSQYRNQTLIKAVIVNFLNPGPYLGWSLVMGPLFMKGWMENPWNGFSLVGGFYSTMVVVMSGMIFLFHLARNTGSKVNRVMIGLSAIALFAFGIYQLGTGIHLLFIR